MKNLILNIREVLFDNICPVCNENIYDKDYEICYNCFDKLKNEKRFRSFGKLYYCFNYSGDFRKLLLAYKNSSRGPLSRTIASLVKEEFFEVLFNEEIDMIIPVPISKKRNRDRGFNQVEEVLNRLNCRYTTIERIKNTKKMYKILNEEKREKNIKGSFDGNLDCSGKNVLIVDDIVTTGATLREFKKAVEQYGKAKKIICFSFALSKTGLKKIVRGVSNVT